MCRFHCYYIWQYTKEFDYVMRLDEDCVLTSAAFDPIELLSEACGDFAVAAFAEETHELTNQTLTLFVNNFIKTIDQPTRKSSPYNQVFPHTNLYVTRTGFWRQPEVQQFLYAIVCNRDSIRFRWGDLPVLGVALNMFAAPAKIYLMSEIGYRHASHDWTFAPERLNSLI
jgi:hypothetical protein